MFVVYVHDVQGGFEDVEYRADRRNGGSSGYILEVAGQYHGLDLAEISVWRYDQYRADSSVHHVEGVAADEDLLEPGSTGDTHDHHIDIVVAYITLHVLNKG